MRRDGDISGKDVRMKSVQIDKDNQLHCWKCGSTALTSGRTTRSKVAFGIAVLLTAPKLRCQKCGEWNNNKKGADPWGGQELVTVADLQVGDRIEYQSLTHEVAGIGEPGALGGLKITTAKGKTLRVTRSTKVLRLNDV